MRLKVPGGSSSGFTIQGSSSLKFSRLTISPPPAGALHQHCERAGREGMLRVSRMYIMRVYLIVILIRGFPFSSHTSMLTRVKTRIISHRGRHLHHSWLQSERDKPPVPDHHPLDEHWHIRRGPDSHHKPVFRVQASVSSTSCTTPSLFL